MDRLGGLVVIAPARRAGDPGSIPGPGENFSLKLLVLYVLKVFLPPIPYFFFYFYLMTNEFEHNELMFFLDRMTSTLTLMTLLHVYQSNSDSYSLHIFTKRVLVFNK